MIVPKAKMARLYYETAISGPPRTGDIWINIPSFSLIPGRPCCSAIVITPACDLANAKTESITILPVVTVNDYLARIAGYSLLRPPLIEFIESKAKRLDMTDKLPRGQRPVDAEFEDLITAVALTTTDEKLKKRADAARECLIGLQKGTLTIEAMADFFLPKDWKKVLRQIFTNAIDDIHFLPPEEFVGEWSAIASPSVVLLRFPVTVRAEVFHAFEDSSDEWLNIRASLPPQLHLGDERPMRVLRLQREFLSDMLTRFARLFVRMGSSDFSEEALVFLEHSMGVKKVV